jgi:folate-binding protein YgfZ
MFSEQGYRALTEGAAVVRRGDRGVLAVTGPDRLTWLQGLVTNDVLTLPIGGICDAAYLTPQGRMITDLRVVNLAERTLLDVPATLSRALQTRLDALLFSEDARVEDVSERLSIVDLHGPLAPSLSAGLGMVRDDAFAVPGCSAFVDSTEATRLVEQLVTRGAVETTLETLDVLRIEAGRPAFLVDMDEHTIPLEAGLEQRAISFTKGCYVGQEVIVRVTHRGGGRVAKRLVGFHLGTVELPETNAVVTSAGKEVGRVTSAAWSPALSEGVALGYVYRDFTAPGTAVEIKGSRGSTPARVATLPFVDRNSSAQV